MRCPWHEVNRAQVVRWVHPGLSEVSLKQVSHKGALKLDDAKMFFCSFDGSTHLRIGEVDSVAVLLALCTQIGHGLHDDNGGDKLLTQLTESGLPNRGVPNCMDIIFVGSCWIVHPPLWSAQWKELYVCPAVPRNPSKGHSALYMCGGTVRHTSMDIKERVLCGVHMVFPWVLGVRPSSLTLLTRFLNRFLPILCKNRNILTHACLPWCKNVE